MHNLTDSPLDREGNIQNLSKDSHLQPPEQANNDNVQGNPISSELKPASLERQYQPDNTAPVDHGLGEGRSIKNNSSKTVLDALNLLSTSSNVNQKCSKVTLNAKQIKTLQQDIIDGEVNAAQIEKTVKTRGDLQLVHTLAVITSNHPSINTALASLATAYPNTTLLLAGLMAFVQSMENAWSDITEGKPAQRLDAQAQHNFISKQLQKHIDNVDKDDARKILKQLKGSFGKRASGLIELAMDHFESFDGNEESQNQFLSRLTRARSQVDSLISLLRDKLQMRETPAPSPPRIDSPDQLKPLELAALMSLGIKL